MAAQLNVEPQLEVSLDGLTLSPDSEERPGAEGAPLLQSPPSPPGVAAAAEGAAEEARRMEQHWGFGLEELFGLALRFFKSERVPSSLRGRGPPGPAPPTRARPG